MAKLKLVYSRAAPKRRRKRAKPSLDPRASIAGRTFEITTDQAEGEHSWQRRVRITLARKGGLSANIATPCRERIQYLAGMVSVMTAANKWSTPTFGMLPMHTIGVVREIIDDAKPVQLVKGDK